MNKVPHFFKNNISRDVAFILIAFFFSALSFCITNFNLYSSEKELALYKEKSRQLNTIIKKADSLNIFLKQDIKYNIILTELLENMNSGLNYNARTLYKFENHLLNNDSVKFYIDSLNQRSFDLIFDIGKINAYKISSERYNSEGQNIYSNLLKSELRVNKNLVSFLSKNLPISDSIQESINNYKTNLQTLATYSDSQVKNKIRTDEINSDDYITEINKIKNEFAFKRSIYFTLILICLSILLSLIILSIKSGYIKNNNGR